MGGPLPDRSTGGDGGWVAPAGVVSSSGAGIGLRWRWRRSGARIGGARRGSGWGAARAGRGGEHADGGPHRADPAPAGPGAGRAAERSHAARTCGSSGLCRCNCGGLTSWVGSRWSTLHLEAKFGTGVVDHSRCCVMAQVVERGRPRGGCWNVRAGVGRVRVPEELSASLTLRPK